MDRQKISVNHYWAQWKYWLDALPGVSVVYPRTSLNSSFAKKKKMFKCYWFLLFYSFRKLPTLASCLHGDDGWNLNSFESKQLTGVLWHWVNKLEPLEGTLKTFCFKEKFMNKITIISFVITCGILCLFVALSQ